jgi:chitodextrinase
MTKALGVRNPRTDTVAPTTPGSLTATPISTSRIDLGWTPSTDAVGVAGYQVWRDGAPRGTTTGLTYSDLGLTPTTTYSYRVSAYDEAGNTSELSNVASATTLTPSTNLPPVWPTIAQQELTTGTSFSLTLAPTDPEGQAVAVTQVTGTLPTGLTFNTSTKIISGTPTAVGVSNVSFRASDGALSADKVIAFNVLNPDATAPSVPTGLTATVVSSTRIDLSWNASSDTAGTNERSSGLKQYRLFRDGLFRKNIDAATLTYADTELAANTTYGYRLRAVDNADNLSALTSTVSATTPSVSARKWYPGHIVTVGNSNARRGNYWKVTTGGAANLLTLPGVRGVQIRYLWNALNPTGSTFDFGPVKETYADSERSVRADLWRCAQNDSQLIVMIEDKTFGNPGENPMPADMAGNDAYVRFIDTDSSGGDGYCACRWNPTVQARFQALIQAFGDAFDDHPNLYGIAFQETATGYDAAQRTATGYTNSGSNAGIEYRDALIAMLKKASDALPHCQIFWYTNFFPTPSTDYRLEEVADAVKNYNGGNSGINMGGPDILPDRSELVTRVYPRFGVPPTGSYGELKLFNSMQFDSYAHTHATSTPDARMPDDTWSAGSLWTMDQLFRWARDNLNLDHVMWENDTQGAQTFIPDATNVIGANQTF